MTIARLRSRKAVTAVGIAFAAQEVPAVPATARDARLDLMLTEREVIDFRLSCSDEGTPPLLIIRLRG